MKFKKLVDLYMEDMEERVKRGSFINKRSITNDKILPYFEYRNVEDITAADIRRWQQDIMSKSVAE